MSTKSLLLASAAYVVAGLVVGGLLATGNASTGPSSSDREIKVAMPVSNADAKRDRLMVAHAVATVIQTAERWRESARLEPAVTGSIPTNTTVLALAAEPPAQDRLQDQALPQGKIASSSPFATQPAAVASPKPAAPPKKQSNSPLSDEQIAGLKERMNLTPSQQAHWPAIEVALRKIGKRLQKTPNGTDPSAAIDPDSPEVQDLKSAAFPLLFTLSEDQKREVRALARVIGLTAVASAI